jgi:hypothetical protein
MFVWIERKRLKDCICASRSKLLPFDKQDELYCMKDLEMEVTKLGIQEELRVEL